MEKLNLKESVADDSFTMYSPSKKSRASFSPKSRRLETNKLDYKQLLCELDNEIEVYESKALNTIQMHEKDFLVAYSAHMGKVYKDLERLKKKANENNFMLKKDQAV